MAFSDFDLKTVVQKFSLTVVRDVDLFSAAVSVPPSAILRDCLDQFTKLAVAVNSEKARSEYIITPIMIELMRVLKPSITIMPGVAFDVDRSQGLAGFCDFLIVRSPEIYYVQAPVVAVVEAKREDLAAGFGQCAAEMVAIRLFNEREGTTVPAVYGVVTSGTDWQFLKLEESKLIIDRSEYYLGDVSKIIGILVAIGRG